MALLMVVSGAVSTAEAQSTTTVTAAWDRNTDALTTGYIVNYGTAPGSAQWSYDAGNQTSAQLTLSQGALYYVTVRAYNTSAQQGPPSNEATIDLRTTTPSPTATITATLQNGNTAVVTWQTANAVSATINGVTVPLSGTQSVPVSATTTFTLVARNSAGVTVTRSATVTLSAPAAPTGSITATLQNGNTAVVTWQTANAVSATINGVTVGLSGTQSVPVSATTTFTLVARNSAGATVTRSATVTLAAPVAPTASITATLQNGTTAVVTWQTANAVSATINGANVPLSGTQSVPVSATTTFTLVARNSAGATVTRSATVVVSPPPTGAPAAPTNMASSVSGTRVSFSWARPAAGAAPDRYLIDVGIQGSTQMLVSGYSVGNVLAVAADLPKGSYTTRVRAANAAGVSGYSNLVSFRVGRKLASPGSFTVRWSGTTAVLSWTAPVADGPVEDVPTSYVLEAGTAPGASNVAQVNLGNVTRFSAPIPSGTYYVRVRAANAYGDSDPTPDIALVAPGAPAAPTTLVASRSNGIVNLRWNAPTGPAPTGYILEAGSAPGLSDIVVAPLGPATTFSAPAPAGTYYLRVRAVNGSGAGLPSNEFVLR